ncbi:Ig-like domain-containing protein [Pseudoalteromonas sp. T1lg65]|uniref:Ig-like domain-containing protein n=1 Tax=Pseudoalteromonas sp. T1lg65 TaxID=2077101 RepID=UPI003F7A0CDD
MQHTKSKWWLWLPSTLFLSTQALAVDCSTLSSWSSQQVYWKGDLVQSEQQAFEAKWYSLNEKPQQHSDTYDVWLKLGSCGGNQAPQLTLISPKDGAILKQNDNAVFSAQAVDNDGTISQVEFFLDQQSLAVVSAPPYQTEWQARLGEYTVSAIATDDKGAVSETQSARITVRNSDTNLAPEIEVITPQPNQQFALNDTVTIEVDARDRDGEISTVTMWQANDKIAEFTQPPFRFQWQAKQLGETHFTITATDNQGATSSQQVVIKIVSDSSGGCKDLAQYKAGTNYQNGDLISNQNRKYRCEVAGWCSSAAAWAYEPGVGQHWQDAWSDQGVCAIAPEVNFIAPHNNATVLKGLPTVIQVTATDADGEINQLDVYANQALLGSFNEGNAQFNWTPQQLGLVELSAVATDNEGNDGQTSIIVTVTDQSVVTSITEPSSGTQLSLGSSVLIKAQATALTGAIDKLDLYANGVLIGSDNSAPYEFNYTPASLGNHTLTVVATTDSGETATSDGVTVKVIDRPTAKTHKLIGYWHNFVNPAGCPIPLNQISPAWDIIDIAFAENDRSSNGTVLFHPFEKDIRSSCPPIDPVQFKSDMKALQAQGKVFVLSLGGAEGTITLNTDADEANFVSSLTQLIQEWGFDGLDIDLESGSNLLHGSQIQARLPRALKQIEQNIGGNMVLTMAPEHPYVHGGMIAYSGIWGAYIPLINELRDTLDLLHVQLYNNGGLANPYESGVAPEGSVNMMVAHAKMLIEGFELANGTRFEPLRDDQVAIGLPSGPSSANSGQAPIANIISALDCLTKGTSCGSIKPSSNYPKFGGVMTWSINWDKHDGYNFSKPVGDKLTQMNQSN